MSQPQLLLEKNAVPKYLSLKLCDELYEIIAAEAHKTGEALIDVAVRMLARSVKRPDLGAVPRKKRGGARPGAGRPAAIAS